MDIVAQRLLNQHILKKTATTPAELVAHMGAVQAQDYAGAKWAIGLRIQGQTDASIEMAMNEGSIIRTHVLRPTWHFVTPEDIRWMLELTGPRILSASASMHRNMGLDTEVLKKCNNIFIKSLEGGQQLDRAALANVLQAAGIPTNELRMVLILMQAEVNGLICSGPRKGKQFTYALLDEWAPGSNSLSRDEALARLARLYFTSHGPATLQDYVWWSGLTVTDARKGIALNGNRIHNEIVDGRDYYAVDFPVSPVVSPALLLPAFDELTVAYKDRLHLIDGKAGKAFEKNLLNPVVFINGRVAGTWKRTPTKNKVQVSVFPFAKFKKAEKEAIAFAADDYYKFLEVEGSIEFEG